LTDDENVVTWGNQNCGGNSTAVRNKLQNIKMIFSTESAFAALTIHGNVVTWGNQSHGGNSSDVKNQLHNIKMIFSNEFAFAAFI